MIIEKQFAAAEYSSSDPRSETILQSANHVKGKFTNQVKWEQPSFIEYLPMMRDMLFKKNFRTPGFKLPSRPLAVSEFFAGKGDTLRSAWLGHSSVLLNLEGKKILMDPVFERKVSIFGPSRFPIDFPLNPVDLPDIDLVIISHNHYDHLNRFTIKLLKEKTGKFIVPLGVGAQLEKWGVSPNQITELDWWQKTEFKDIRIISTPSQHFSGRGLSDRDNTLWSSWVLEGENHKIFFSGDSGYFDGFKTIGDKYGPFDITYLECGAYNEKWRHIHMLPEETVKAHLDLRGKLLHPIHLGTFNLALHPWFEPMERVATEAEMKDIRYIIPIPGEIIDPLQLTATDKWWKKYMSKNSTGDK